MNINLSDLVKSVTSELKHSDIVESFIREIEKGLTKMDERKELTIDRFEGDIAVCENRETNEMINIKVKDLPEGAKEGAILTYKEGRFFLNKDKEQEVSQRIKEKMDNLWNN